MSATIGDDLGDPVYEFEWTNGLVRTTDEIGDLSEFECDIEDIIAVAREDPECEVRAIGFK